MPLYIAANRMQPIVRDSLGALWSDVSHGVVARGFWEMLDAEPLEVVAEVDPARLPTVVVATEGTNTLVNERPERAVLWAIEYMQRARAAGARVVWMNGLPAVNTARMPLYNAALERVAPFAADAVVRAEDDADLGALDGQTTHPELWSDANHPSDAGYARWAALIPSAVRRVSAAPSGLPPLRWTTAAAKVVVAIDPLFGVGIEAGDGSAGVQVARRGAPLLYGDTLPPNAARPTLVGSGATRAFAFARGQYLSDARGTWIREWMTLKRSGYSATLLLDLTAADVAAPEAIALDQLGHDWNIDGLGVWLSNGRVVMQQWYESRGSDRVAGSVTLTPGRHVLTVTVDPSRPRDAGRITISVDGADDLATTLTTVGVADLLATPSHYTYLPAAPGSVGVSSLGGFLLHTPLSGDERAQLAQEIRSGGWR
jgi:hypothetical protein